MLEAVKVVPGLLKEWRFNGDSIYELVSCCAGLLTIAAYLTGERPSEVLAGSMQSLGANSVAEWFDSGLPPLVAHPDAVKSYFFLSLAGGWLLTLIGKPLSDAGRDSCIVDRKARGVIGSRGSYFMWLLLMTAAQFGSLQWIPTWFLSPIPMIFGAAVLAVLVGGYLFYTAYRLRKDQITSVAGEWVSRALRDLRSVVLTTMLAVVYAAIGPLARIAEWLLATDRNEYADIDEQAIGEPSAPRTPNVASPSPDTETTLVSRQGRGEGLG